MATEVEGPTWEAEQEEQPKRRGRPTNEEIQQKILAMEKDKTVGELMNQNSLIIALIGRIAALEDQVKSKNEPIWLGPPQAPRNDTPHINVFVSPDTCVRIEIPEGYKGEGFDGIPVKGYINHANSVGNR